MNELKRVLVVGAGTMGSQIALQTALSGRHEVTLVDSVPGQLERARGTDVLARDDWRIFAASPALLALSETEAVDVEALTCVADEGAASAERLIVRMREDRRKRARHRHGR